MLQTELKTPTSTRHALKEWAVAVDSLRDGETLVTVRKGGIRESAREFRMEHRVFALFPTYEHQNADQLGEEYRERLQRVAPADVPPATVRLNAWAEVTDVVEVTDEEAVHAVSGFSVFSPAYAIERLQWRPRKPLHILLLRVFRLHDPLSLDLLPTYGGCKSWIDLEVDVSLQQSVPALDQQAFDVRRRLVLEALPTAGWHPVESE